MAAIASFQLAAVAPACAKRSVGAKGLKASASSGFMGTSLATPVRAGVARAAGASALKVEARLDAGVGVFGNKAGMTQIFTDEGLCIPVSVIAVQKGNVVTQVSIPTAHEIKQHVTDVSVKSGGSSDLPVGRGARPTSADRRHFFPSGFRFPAGLSELALTIFSPHAPCLSGEDRRHRRLQRGSGCLRRGC